MQGVATVVLRNGRDPIGLVSRKVAGFQTAAMGVGELLQSMGNFTAVKRLALGIGYRTQTPRSRRKLKQLADLRRTALGQKMLGESGLAAQLLHRRGPFFLHHHAQQITPLGNLDG